MAIIGKWLLSLVGVEMTIGRAMLIAMIAHFLVAFIKGLRIERIEEVKKYDKE
jgi:hypothetical protein